MKEVNPHKENLLLVNKADMLTPEQRFGDIAVIEVWG